MPGRDSPRDDPTLRSNGRGKNACRNLQGFHRVKIGFVGLGDQGEPIARRIAAAGHPLTVWARRAEQCEPLRAEGATVADTLAEVGANSDLVGVCVFGPHDVDSVLFAEGGIVSAMKPGGLVVVHSTISPADVLDVATRAAEHGITVIDAPVSGGRAAAEAGELVLMLGGDSGALDSYSPIAAAFADRIFRMGDVGSAQTAKLLNNALLAAHMAIADDALIYAQSQHIDVEDFAKMTGQGSGRSFGLDLVMGSKGLRNMGWFPGTAPLGKDVDALRAAVTDEGSSGIPVLLAAAQTGIDRLRGAV
jgi:3-hydroxyisobutyrate dehydrogenase